MTLTLKAGRKTSTVALRPDTAEYLMAATTINPHDWRIKDLILATWALAQQLKAPNG